MKKEITAIICVVLAVWFFFMGFEIGIYKERNSGSSNSSSETTLAPVTVSTAATTAAPATAAPETTAATTQADTTAADATEAEETTAAADDNADPSSMSKEDVIAKMSEAFKTLKATQNCTAVKNETVTINLTELSVSSLKDTVNNIIQGLAGAETETYVFENGTANGGTDKDGNAIEGTFTMSSLIPPTDKEWTCDPAGVASATATKNGDSTTYQITLVEEDTTFDNPIPTYSSTVYSYLDLTSLDIPVAKITDASMHYSGTSVAVTVDGSGNVTEVHFIMPMNGYGQAKVAVVTGDASFEGSDDEDWTFTY